MSFIHVDLNLMKWDRINRKWLLPFAVITPLLICFWTAPFASLFQSFQSLCIIVICGYKLNFTGLIMAKKWEPPYQDRQPVIGLGYLEKTMVRTLPKLPKYRSKVFFGHFSD